MRCSILLIVSLFAISACTGSGITASTQNHSLAQIDLEALVVQPGDLPPMDAVLEKVVPSPFFAEKRSGIATSFARLLKKDDNVFGNIYVDIYMETAEAKKAYDNDAKLLQESVQFGYTLISPPVGEQALLQYRGKDDLTAVIILRCHAYINISLPVSREATLNYAKRLDARLTPLVCS